MFERVIQRFRNAGIPENRWPRDDMEHSRLCWDVDDISALLDEEKPSLLTEENIETIFWNFAGSDKHAYYGALISFLFGLKGYKKVALTTEHISWAGSLSLAVQEPDNKVCSLIMNSGIFSNLFRTYTELWKYYVEICNIAVFQGYFEFESVIAVLANNNLLTDENIEALTHTEIGKKNFLGICYLALKVLESHGILTKVASLRPETFKKILSESSNAPVYAYSMIGFATALNSIEEEKADEIVVGKWLERNTTAIPADDFPLQAFIISQNINPANELPETLWQRLVSNENYEAARKIAFHADCMNGFTLKNKDHATLLFGESPGVLANVLINYTNAIFTPDGLQDKRYGFIIDMLSSTSYQYDMSAALRLAQNVIDLVKGTRKVLFSDRDKELFLAVLTSCRPETLEKEFPHLCPDSLDEDINVFFDVHKILKDGSRDLTDDEKSSLLEGLAEPALTAYFEFFPAMPAEEKQKKENKESTFKCVML